MFLYVDEKQAKKLREDCQLSLSKLLTARINKAGIHLKQKDKDEALMLIVNAADEYVRHLVTLNKTATDKAHEKVIFYSAITDVLDSLLDKKRHTRGRTLSRSNSFIQDDFLLQMFWVAEKYHGDIARISDTEVTRLRSLHSDSIQKAEEDHVLAVKSSVRKYKSSVKKDYEEKLRQNIEVEHARFDSALENIHNISDKRKKADLHEEFKRMGDAHSDDILRLQLVHRRRRKAAKEGNNTPTQKKRADKEAFAMRNIKSNHKKAVADILSAHLDVKKRSKEYATIEKKMTHASNKHIGSLVGLKIEDHDHQQNANAALRLALQESRNAHKESFALTLQANPSIHGEHPEMKKAHADHLNQIKDLQKSHSACWNPFPSLGYTPAKTNLNGDTNKKSLQSAMEDARQNYRSSMKNTTNARIGGSKLKRRLSYKDMTMKNMDEPETYWKTVVRLRALHERKRQYVQAQRESTTHARVFAEADHRLIIKDNIRNHLVDSTYKDANKHEETEKKILDVVETHANEISNLKANHDEGDTLSSAIDKANENYKSSMENIFESVNGESDNGGQTLQRRNSFKNMLMKNMHATLNHSRRMEKIQDLLERHKTYANQVYNLHGWKLVKKRKSKKINENKDWDMDDQIKEKNIEIENLKAEIENNYVSKHLHREKEAEIKKLKAEMENHHVPKHIHLNALKMSRLRMEDEDSSEKIQAKTRENYIRKDKFKKRLEEKELQLNELQRKINVHYVPKEKFLQLENSTKERELHMKKNYIPKEKFLQLENSMKERELHMKKNKEKLKQLEHSIKQKELQLNKLKAKLKQQNVSEDKFMQQEESDELTVKMNHLEELKSHMMEQYNSLKEKLKQTNHHTSKNKSELEKLDSKTKIHKNTFAHLESRMKESHAHNKSLEEKLNETQKQNKVLEEKMKKHNETIVKKFLKMAQAHNKTKYEELHSKVNQQGVALNSLEKNIGKAFQKNLHKKGKLHKNGKQSPRSSEQNKKINKMLGSFKSLLNGKERKIDP